MSTENLGVQARTAAGEHVTLSGPVSADLGPAREIQVGATQATWTYPDKHLTVVARSDQGRLALTLRSSTDQSISWPVTGTDPSARSLQIPRGEGLSLPVDDPLWNSAGDGLDGLTLPMTGDLNMPFWGYSSGRTGASYLAPTDVGTSLSVASRDGRLQATGVHEFSHREQTLDYTVTFALTDGSPIATAKDYRRWLIEHDELHTLKEKAQQSPEISKLSGAFHAYLFGTGRTATAMNKLKAAGVDRMLVSWDADFTPMPADAIHAAQSNGYLAAPYDTWANAQPPETADAPTSKWPAPVWDEACVRDAEGKIVTGFGGRGCYVSSQAMAQAEPEHHYLANRIATMSAAGPKAYFLDVDAASALFTDYSPDHPMNQKQDRRNRLERMGWLSQRYHFVVGSEKAAGWASEAVAYSHGSATVNMAKYWPFLRNREEWGGYWPPERPTGVFKPATMPDALRTTMFAPAYRAPLYATVLHDSVVNVDRPELTYYKINGVQRDRALLAMIAANPLNFALDQQVIDEKAAEIAALQRAFKPLHKATFNLPLTKFRYLGDGTQVQRSTFGDDTAVVTANFGETAYRGLPSKCATIAVAGQPTRQFCPREVS
ncbi:glycoside hydrolase [Streptomyces platensis]|uniref:glycoside hydrolase n=1 Tax=Streptomyces platensis TaxID=58346 RepID=UPI002ED22A30|nr:glycoside hydrolase [Streptomyces platensis]